MIFVLNKKNGADGVMVVCPARALWQDVIVKRAAKPIWEEALSILGF